MDVLLITGPAGVGKSTVGYELSRQLSRDGTSHALIDTDELDRIYPSPPDLFRVTEESLTAVWRVLRRYGASRLILIGVYLDRDKERAWIERAVPNADFTCVRLVASQPSLIERVMRREVGSGADEQVERTVQQLASLDAEVHSALHVVVTDQRSPTAVATEIAALWPPRPD